MRLRILELAGLSLAVAMVGAGCSPTLTGAPCSDDTYCPSGQFCNAGLCSTTAPTDSGAVDSGPQDSGPADGGPNDAGPVDAGPNDAGAVDAGPLDAGFADAGATDGGLMDAGPIDAGSIDGGPLDAGPEDAGLADAGTTDGGPGDSGSGTDAGSCPVQGTTDKTGCTTVGATLCDPNGTSLLTCTSNLATGRCKEWVSSSCSTLTELGLVCSSSGVGSSGSGTAHCACPAATNGEIWVDVDGGAAKGIAPTGAKSPSVCRFPTLTQGLKAVPDGGTVIATGANSVPNNWLPSTAYALGSKVTPELPNGHEYQASIGGKSEPKTQPQKQPDWPTDGGSVLDGDPDGGVTWVDIGLVQPVVFDNETFPLTVPAKATLLSTGCGLGALLDVIGCNAQAWVIALNNGTQSIVLEDGASLQGFEIAPTTGGKVPDSAITCTGGTIRLDELILDGTSLVDSTLHMNRGISLSPTQSCSVSLGSLQPVLVSGFNTGVAINSPGAEASLQDLYALGNVDDGLLVQAATSIDIEGGVFAGNGQDGIDLKADQGSVSAIVNGANCSSNASHGIEVGGSLANPASETMTANTVGANGASGFYFGGSSTLQAFTGNQVFSNNGPQVDFAAPSATDGGWVAGPPGCSTTAANAFYCYNHLVDGGIGVAASDSTIKVNASNNSWQEGPLVGVDFSASVTVGATCVTNVACP